MKKTNDSSKKPRLSKWISGEVKPDLPGYYQRRYSEFEEYPKLQEPDYWNGKKWFYGSSSSACVNQSRTWRGLASDPSKAWSKS